MKLTWVDSLCFTRVQLPLFQTTATSACANACSLSLQSTLLFVQDRQNQFAVLWPHSKCYEFWWIVWKRSPELFSQLLLWLCGCSSSLSVLLNPQERVVYSTGSVFFTLLSTQSQELSAPHPQEDIFLMWAPLPFLFQMRCCLQVLHIFFFFTQKPTPCICTVWKNSISYSEHA